MASEGEVRAQLSADGKTGILVEVNIQTDFAARNDKFKKFVADVVTAAVSAKPGQLLEDLPYPGTSKTLAQVRDELMAQIGEKITLRRWTRLERSTPAGSRSS